MDLENKSEEFLSVSPTGRVPVGARTATPSTSQGRQPVPRRGLRVLKASARRPETAGLHPHLDGFGRRQHLPGCVRDKRGRERGFSETQIAEALESLKRALAALEERLGDRRMYLAHGFSLADIAHAGNFVRLRELAEGGEADLADYPNVIA